MNDKNGDRNQQVIGVVICTAKRLEMVKRCIISVMNQTGLPTGFRHEIIVVENDRNDNARASIEALAQTSNIPVHYVLETRRGIPFARNRTITEALTRGYDWMTLIDDDEQARPGWLSNLIRGALDHNAEITNGPVVRHYNATLPAWWKLLKPLNAPTGHLLDEAPTNNTLLSIKVVSQDGLNIRFDERLTFGHEDIDFFRRAKSAGAKIVWVHDAVVEEEIPASRMTNSRLLERVEMQGAAFAFATKIRDGTLAAWLKFGPKATRRIVSGLFLLGLTPLFYLAGKQRGEIHYYRALSRLIRGSGHLRGLTRFQPDYYAKIDGN